MIQNDEINSLEPEKEEQSLGNYEEEYSEDTYEEDDDLELYEPSEEEKVNLREAEIMAAESEATLKEMRDDNTIDWDNIVYEKRDDDLEIPEITDKDVRVIVESGIAQMLGDYDQITENCKRFKELMLMNDEDLREATQIDPDADIVQTRFEIKEQLALVQSMGRSDLALINDPEVKNLISRTKSMDYYIKYLRDKHSDINIDIIKEKLCTNGLFLDVLVESGIASKDVVDASYYDLFNIVGRGYNARGYITNSMFEQTKVNAMNYAQTEEARKRLTYKSVYDFGVTTTEYTITFMKELLYFILKYSGTTDVPPEFESFSHYFAEDDYSEYVSRIKENFGMIIEYMNSLKSNKKFVEMTKESIVKYRDFLKMAKEVVYTNSMRTEKINKKYNRELEALCIAKTIAMYQNTIVNEIDISKLKDENGEPTKSSKEEVISILNEHLAQEIVFSNFETIILSEIRDMSIYNGYGKALLKRSEEITDEELEKNVLGVYDHIGNLTEENCSAVNNNMFLKAAILRESKTAKDFRYNAIMMNNILYDMIHSLDFVYSPEDYKMFFDNLLGNTEEAYPDVYLAKIINKSDVKLGIIKILDEYINLSKEFFKDRLFEGEDIKIKPLNNPKYKYVQSKKKKANKK